MSSSLKVGDRVWCYYKLFKKPVLGVVTRLDAGLLYGNYCEVFVYYSNKHVIIHEEFIDVAITQKLINSC